MADLAIFAAAADLLRRLRTIPPGKSMQVSKYMLQDITVPACLYDRQTPEFLVEWFRTRLPFRCTVTPDMPILATMWTFHRPQERADG